MVLKTSVPVIIDAAEKMIRRAGSRKPEEICRAYHVELLDMDLKKRLKAYYVFCKLFLEKVAGKNGECCISKMEKVAGILQIVNFSF